MKLGRCLAWVGFVTALALFVGVLSGNAARTAGVTVATLVAPNGLSAPQAADVRVGIGAVASEPSQSQPPPVANGSTVTVTSLHFFVYMLVFPDRRAPGPDATKVRVELSDGLTWGADAPDPVDETCTSTPRSGECQITVSPNQAGDGYYWDVTAARPGTYTYRAEIVETSDTDPDLSNNVSSITINVTEASGEGGAATVVSASPAKFAPSKPVAGRTVTVIVEVRADGASVKPSAVACKASLAGAKLQGTPRSLLGRATCSYRTPRTAKGRRISGVVWVTVGGKRLARAFSVRLG